jgi:hypothetical protein
MNKIVRFTLALTTLASAAVVRAEPAPDPTDFMAHLTAFAESCGSRFPDLADTPARLVASMEPDDRKLYDDTRRGAGFDAALVKARAELASSPVEGQHDVCKAMHDGVKKP